MSDPVTSAWHVYLLRCADGSLYTGVAKNLDQRLAKHNAGQGAKYTRGRRPVALVWSQVAESHGQALRHELLIKRLDRQAKLRLIAEADGDT
jgi:putative endonuclease